MCGMAPGEKLATVRAAMRAIVLLAIAFSALAVACSPRIGDGCSSAANCSVNGDRFCDITQPSGACIVFDCQPDQCPDNTVCVRFNPAEPRLSVVACMRPCTSNGDCRANYQCIDAMTFEDGLYAEVVDTSPRRFCAADR